MSTDPNTLMDQARCIDNCIPAGMQMAVLIGLIDTLSETSNSSSGVPSGVILMWSGPVATIPSGWNLCDGTSGTPDLRDKFIVGAKQDDAGVAKTNIRGSLSQIGGSVVTGVNPQLINGWAPFIPQQSVTWLAWATGLGGNEKPGIPSNSSQDFLPPYYALAYIMKL